MNTLFLIIIGICALSLVVVLFSIQLLGFLRYLDEHKNTLVAKTACAGSEKPNTPNEIKITNLRRDGFRTSSGQNIDYKEYICYIAKGQSMLLGGINDSDLLLTRPVDVSTISFSYPCILILRRENNALKKAAWVNDLAEVKVRRSWAKCNISRDNPIDIAKDIMANPIFKDLQNKYGNKFPERKEMISDFETRIERYKQDYPSCMNDGDENCITIISTTLDTRKQEVHFSIHPARTAEGEVVYSFNLRATA